MTRRLVLLILCCDLLACGLDSSEPHTQTQSSSLEGAEDVPLAEIQSTLAVWLGGCSGTLVTPWWVLTAAHCGDRTGSFVLFGNNNTFAPTAKVAASFRHPSWPNDGTCHRNDAQLLKLETPLYPRLPDGKSWEGHRRDLFRGSLSSLVNQWVDIYASGCAIDPEDEEVCGAGILRKASFEVESLSNEFLKYDQIDDELIWDGDSGAGVLTCGAVCEIAAIQICNENQIVEWVHEGVRSDLIASWFDTTIGGDWDTFDYPSRIHSATLPASILR